MPFHAGPAGAADTVHEVLGFVRQVIVDNQFDTADIEPARCDVGRHQDLVTARLEAFDGAVPLLHGPVGVNLLHFRAHAFNALRDAAGLQLGPRKDQHTAPVLLEQRTHHVVFLVFGNDVQLVRYFLRRGSRRGDFYGHRIGHMLIDQFPNIGRHRRRKKQCLFGIGEAAQDAVDLRLEAHIEHPVGFVKHQDLDVTEVQISLIDVIVHPSGSGNKNARVLVQIDHLVRHFNPAD